MGNEEQKDLPRPTLRAWAASRRSQREAANEIGVPEATLNRWLNGHMHPEGLSVHRLHELGVRVEDGLVVIG